MIHILLRDQRTAAASGSTMNVHRIEVPCCIERTCAAWIKEGNLCLLGKYITTMYGGDTNMIQTAGAYVVDILAGLALVGIIAGYSCKSVR